MGDYSIDATGTNPPGATSQQQGASAANAAQPSAWDLLVQRAQSLRPLGSQFGQAANAYQQKGINYLHGDGFRTDSQVYQPLPPPPSPPGITGDAKHAFLVGLDNMRVGNNTVGGLTKTLHNESNGLTGGVPGELTRGKAAEAHAIINNAQSYRPHPMASSMAGTPLPDDQQIMREAYYNRLMDGSDIAQGRTYFGNSTENLSSRPIGNSRQTVYSQYGPYTWGKNAPQYIYLYNDPIKK